MIWLSAVFLIYFALLIGVTYASVRPYRIPSWISMGSLGHPMEEAKFVSLDGISLRASWTETSNADKVAILCHGYMMNRSELVPEAHHLAERGFSCLLIDFRSHGRSEHGTSSIGFRERLDVLAAVEFVKLRQPNSKILLFGSSMGAAAILFALAENPELSDAAVIDSAYSRLNEAITGWWRFLGGDLLATLLAPVPYLAPAIAKVNPLKVDVAEAINKIGSKPLLFFHGECDRLALPAGARRNFEAAVGPKKIVWFANCNHSEGRWIKPDDYRKELFAWLEEIGF